MLGRGRTSLFSLAVGEAGSATRGRVVQQAKEQTTLIRVGGWATLRPGGHWCARLEPTSASERWITPSRHQAMSTGRNNIAAVFIRFGLVGCSVFRNMCGLKPSPRASSERNFCFRTSYIPSLRGALDDRHGAIFLPSLATDGLRKSRLRGQLRLHAARAWQ
eukprot:11233923-Alexandrium_andersonii.AAC.1